MGSTELCKLTVLDGFLQGKLWFLGDDMGVRITGCSLKVEPSGYLVILRGRTAEGPRVLFLGCKSLEALLQRLGGIPSLPLAQWKEDKYAFDKN